MGEQMTDFSGGLITGTDGVPPGSHVDYALRYARIGWHVFPCHHIENGVCSCGNTDCKSPGKHPRTPHGVKDATVDPMQIRNWWAKWPKANLAVATGSISGILVVDIDPRNGGNDTWSDLVDSHNDYGYTVTASTGGGGQHLVFAYPTGGRYGCKALPGGVDIKGDGGYIIVEPSNHASGGAYVWEADSDPLEGTAPIAAPGWILGLIGTRKETGSSGEPLPAPVMALSPAEVQDIRAALSYIPADNRDTWYQAGMALHATGAGHQAYGLWTEWSQQSDKFDAADQSRVWRSFTDKADGLTVASLFATAKQYGYTFSSRPLSIGSPPTADLAVEELNYLSAAAWYGQPVPERQWLLPHWIPMAQTTALYGDGGVGKTLLAQQLATCVAAGLPFFDMQVRQGPVLFIACEDSLDELHMRQDAINDMLGLEYADLKQLYISSRLGMDNLLMVFQREGADGALTWFHDQVRRACGGLAPVMTVVDTAADTFGGNENVRGQVRQFIQRALTSLALEFRQAVLLCAHPSVAGLTSGSGTGGSTAWSNSVRSRLYLYRDEELGTVVLDRKKANYAAIGERIEMMWAGGAFSKPLPGIEFPGVESKDANIQKAILELLQVIERQGEYVNQGTQKRASTQFVRLGKIRGYNYTKGDYDRVLQAMEESRIIEVTDKPHPSRRGETVKMWVERGR